MTNTHPESGLTLNDVRREERAAAATRASRLADVGNCDRNPRTNDDLQEVSGSIQIQDVSPTVAEQIAKLLEYLPILWRELDRVGPSAVININVAHDPSPPSQGDTESVRDGAGRAELYAGPGATAYALELLRQSGLLGNDEAACGLSPVFTPEKEQRVRELCVEQIREADWQAMQRIRSTVQSAVNDAPLKGDDLGLKLGESASELRDKGSELGEVLRVGILDALKLDNEAAADRQVFKTADIDHDSSPSVDGDSSPTVGGEKPVGAVLHAPTGATDVACDRCANCPGRVQ